MSFPSPQYRRTYSNLLLTIFVIFLCYNGGKNLQIGAYLLHHRRIQYGDVAIRKVMHASTIRNHQCIDYYRDTRQMSYGNKRRFALSESNNSNNNQDDDVINVKVATKEQEDEFEEDLSEADKRLCDMTPPAVSFSRNSILFSEKPITQRNNEVLTLWRQMKLLLPPFITGAWSWRDPYLAEENPLDAFYNILFVRLPVIIMSLIYIKNLINGHPLVMDYGDGPIEISPFIVLGVVAIVLA